MGVDISGSCLPPGLPPADSRPGAGLSGMYDISNNMYTFDDRHLTVVVAVAVAATIEWMLEHLVACLR